MFLFTARRSFRALIQASRRRRPNVITGTLTGTASAPTCSGSQTGAQDDVKAAEMLPFSPGLNILFESSERLLTEQLDYNLPWLRGRGDHDRRYCGLGWQQSGEGKPKGRVKVRKHGPERLHTPMRSLGAAISRLISAGTRARTVCLNSSVVHRLLVLSVSS